MSPARLRPRTAVIALGAIAVAGAGVVAFGTLHGPPSGTTFATGHSHAGTEATATTDDRARADALVSATTAAVAQYADVAAAEASGYRWIGDDGGEYRHYVSPEYLVDDDQLDPARIESLVYRTTSDGALELVSGMYILKPGATEPPDVAGPLAPWHEHTNLCFDGRGTIAGTNDSGSCPKGSYNVGTPPMLHVWVVANPDGPFAAIDENGIVESH